jgi:peptide/nickel transport system permease protein
MISYIIRRLWLAAVVLILVSIFIFLAMRLLPGDPILIYIKQQDVNYLAPDMEAQLRHQYGLDKSLPVQYISWISNVFRGDLGVSIYYQEPVKKLLAERLPVSLNLAIPSFILAVLVGVLAGMISGLKRGKIIDTLVSSVANLGIAAPNFWLGILLIYLFSVSLKWLPAQGYTSPFDNLWLNIKQLIMPVFVVASWGVSFFARQTRSSILEIIRQDYIRTAWSKGLTERVIVVRHAMRNAFIPIVTVMGMVFIMMVGAQVITENVFSIPGIGRLMVSAIFGQDYQIVQALVLVISALVILVNLAVDISYCWLDPRIALGRE